MKKHYSIEIGLKSGILDNAGKATTRALKSLGFITIQDVRIGKRTTMTCDTNDIEKIAKALVNEVMEDYTIKCLDDVD